MFNFLLHVYVFRSYLLLNDFSNSFEAYSNNNELFASINAVLLALLKAAAVPREDLGSTPPSENR